MQNKKRNIITLAGDPASGKGSVSKILVEELNYDLYKSGDYMRKLAKEANMNITQYSVYVKDHPEIDMQVEARAKEYAKNHDNLIIDARLGWYVVPESFKVYLKVDLDVAAKRAFNDISRKDTENLSTIEEQKQDMKKRYEVENERYFNVYGVRKDDMSNYDLVVDTTTHTPQMTADVIKEEYIKWLKKG